MIYIFSDGYEDQFGGPDGRKFMIRQFKELLQRIHLQPSEEQKNTLEQTFDDWKGATRQMDDVLVIGIRL
jgi:serine phosphatase RsbU (regulator of sigma subunit)